MTDSFSKTVRTLLVLFGLVLALCILIPAGLIYDSLEQQQESYLRSRIAGLAARLEGLPLSGSRLDLQAVLQREEPLLLRLGLYDRRSLAAAGTETDPASGQAAAHRAVVPYQTPRGVAYAELELARGEVESLADDARLAAMFPALGGVLVFCLAMGAAWSIGRAQAIATATAELAAKVRLEKFSAAIAKEVEAAALPPPAVEQASTALAAIEPTRLQLLAAELTLFASSPAPVYAMVDAAALVNSIRPKLQDVELTLDGEPGTAFRADQALLGEALLRVVKLKSESQPGAAVRVELVRLKPEGVAIRVTGGAALSDPGPLALATARKLMGLMAGTIETALPDGAAELRLGAS